MTGFEILDRLKSDVETRNIPVIINTSKILDDERASASESRTPSAILDKGIEVARGGDRSGS